MSYCQQCADLQSNNRQQAEQIAEMEKELAAWKASHKDLTDRLDRYIAEYDEHCEETADLRTRLDAAQKENAELKGDQRRLDLLTCWLKCVDSRAQFFALETGPYFGQCTLTMYNGRTTKQFTGQSIRAVIDDAALRATEKEKGE